MEFPTYPLLIDDRSAACISTYSGWALGPGYNFNAGGPVLWPANDRALFIPFRVPVPVTVCKLAAGMGGTAPTFDLGIYDALGNRLVSTGNIVGTAGVEHIVDVTDTPLLPGMYYLAMAAAGASSQVTCGTAAGIAALNKLFGLRQMATARPLPATATFATMASTQVPIIAAYLRPE